MNTIIQSIASLKQFIIAESQRPWKLFSLAIGIGLLILGALTLDFPDWDIPISIIMAIPTYLTAAWSVRVILQRQWHFFPLMLLVTWFSVDGCYSLYWSIQNQKTLDLMRWVNFPASLSLYWVCGLVWLYRGTLNELLNDLKQLRFSIT